MYSKKTLMGKSYVQKSSLRTHIFTDSELKGFFSRADNLNQNVGFLYSSKIAPIIFRLMYSCGLRPNEARELALSDVNLHSGELFIRHNKQYRERKIVMSDDMLELCKEYVDERTSFGISSEWFFFTKDGKKLNTGQLGNLFQRCWQGSTTRKIRPNARPYDLRHQFTSTILQKWLDEGKDLFSMLPYLREYLGHSCFSSTVYYIHLLPEHLLHSKNIDWQKLEELIPGVSHEN